MGQSSGLKVINESLGLSPAGTSNLVCSLFVRITYVQFPETESFEIILCRSKQTKEVCAISIFPLFRGCTSHLVQHPWWFFRSLYNFVCLNCCVALWSLAEATKKIIFAPWNDVSVKKKKSYCMKVILLPFLGLVVQCLVWEFFLWNAEVISCQT